MMGQQMTDAGVPGAVINLDLSAESQDITRRRAEVRGLDNIEFVQGSLLDVGELGLGTFDYIDCCGVLNHMEEPLAGLQALFSVLAPDGGLGTTVYGELGRTGLYRVQDMLRTLGPVDEDDASRVETAKRLLEILPPTNWFVRNGQLNGHKGGRRSRCFRSAAASLRPRLQGAGAGRTDYRRVVAHNRLIATRRLRPGTVVENARTTGTSAGHGPDGTCCLR